MATTSRTTLNSMRNMASDSEPKVYFTGTKLLQVPSMFRSACELDALPFIMDPAVHKASTSSGTNVLNGPTMFARDTKTACTHDETGRQTVFDAILDAEPNHSTKGLVDEAFPLAIGVWCILKNPEVEMKMLEDLRTVETVMTAVIHETLRISSPAPGILTRLVPAEGARYGSHLLPADLFSDFVSTAQRLIHYGPTLFPEPETFMPERWLDNSDKVSKENLTPFSKGPRMCVGLNLSYMEAYVFLGNLIR
ncbi:cytochrome P450 [Fusarium redolens]|uniref:Cytochrome P450 n=1 Tax=Fusarium redolens TaxID=48865 RepID=A0A9P9HQ21_FUSRE|nr:cytochrome P450 [Fusarium redolens]KAH7261008.1 cytochrome P450 [Fusarium redolens]